MEVIRITSGAGQLAQDLLELYLEIFPASQRHERADFENLLIEEKQFHANVVLMNGAMIGFFNYWEFDNFVFLEHLAVEPPMQGHKLGEKLVKLLQSNTEKPIVLEVERAEDSEFGERRIEFYRRLGFEIVANEYEQPPYRAGESYLPLHMMCNDMLFIESHFHEVKSQLYKQVYKS